MDEVARVNGQGPGELERRIARGAPVILTGMTDTWSPRMENVFVYLRRRFGDRRVLVARTDGHKLVVGADGIAQRQARLDDFIDGVEAGRRDGYLVTPRSMLPGLIEDLDPPDAYRRAAWNDARLWVGPADFCTPLHQDLPENFFVQLSGSKRVFLFPPQARGNLYPHGMLSRAPNFARVDAERPDYEAFPRFRALTPMTCVVGHGEMLYIPRRWWHQLRSLEASASINLWFANGLTAMLATALQSYAKLRKMRP